MFMEPSVQVILIPAKMVADDLILLCVYTAPHCFNNILSSVLGLAHTNMNLELISACQMLRHLSSVGWMLGAVSLKIPFHSQVRLKI